MIYETYDTPANRQIQQNAGYQDGLYNRPSGANDRFGNKSPALKALYDRAYIDGHNRYRDLNPEPLKVSTPMQPGDYAIAFREDVENMPIDVPCLAISERNDNVAVVIRDEDDDYDVVLGFDNSGYGLGGPITEITGWYPIRKVDLPAAKPAADLQAERSAAADAAYEAYDFGYQVEEANGWEYTIPGGEMTRTVYLLPAGDENDGDEANSFTATCTVRFKPDSAEIAEIYATDAQGNDIGADGGLA